jgi:uncharacterized protein YjbI with pentapeptide repeats
VQGAHLTWAILDHASLLRASLDPAALNDAKSYQGALMPDGWRNEESLTRTDMEGLEATAEGAPHLESRNLAHRDSRDLREADLTGALDRSTPRAGKPRLGDDA